MTIRTAVVTAAGWGTRFLPATKAQPKEMLPLVDKPIIQYVIEEARDAGIEQIIVVTAGGKRAIEDHFDRSHELEDALARKGQTKLLEEIRAISDRVSPCYIRQKEQLGLGHAILITRQLVGDEPFAVFLPDDIIVAERPCIGQMIEVYNRYKCSVIAVERVEPEQTKSYGIIDPKPIDERTHQIKDMVEKPEPEEAPSNLGIVGRYILTPEIFEFLAQTPPGKGGEIQLTDGLRGLLTRQAIYGYEFEGRRYDTGNPVGLLRASIEIALGRPDLGDAVRGLLQSLDLGQRPPSCTGQGAAAKRAPVTAEE